MRELQTGNKDSINVFGANVLKGHIPHWTWQEVENTEDISKSVKQWDGAWRIRDLHNDFKKFIAAKSNGFTKAGTELLSQSIEVYMYIYCIHGAQARTKQSIYGLRASSLETQNVFRQLSRE